MKQLRAHAVCGGLVIACVLAILSLILVDAGGQTPPALFWHILLNLQLPLICTALLVGAALAVSSASLQVVLNNPLADPGIIGISSGASLVAAIMLLVVPAHYSTGSLAVLPAACFGGALLSTWLIYLLARRLRGATTAVILAGIAISTLSSALMAWLFVFADAQAMRNLTFWLMGSLYQTNWSILAVAGPIMLFTLIALCHLAPRLNWLYGGSRLTAAAGVSPARLNKQVLIISALGVGAAVSVAGSIAFVGLLVPHFMRLLIGYDNRRLLPACALAGALVLLLVAVINEYSHQIALPVSMITATVGGPLLLWALYRGQWKLA